MRSSNLWFLMMAIFDEANVNPPRPASGRKYEKTMPWLHDETQFACDYCGDLVMLEKAKLRDDIRGPDKAFAQMLCSKRSARSCAYSTSGFAPFISLKS